MDSGSFLCFLSSSSSSFSPWNDCTKIDGDNNHDVHSDQIIMQAFLIHALENELLFSRHPLSAGPLFRLLEMGLSCALHSSSPAESSAGTLLDRVYHVGFHFFECPPGYFFLKVCCNISDLNIFVKNEDGHDLCPFFNCL